MKDLVVLIDDAGAAEYRKDIHGWVSRYGRYFGGGSLSEKDARSDGCTHVRCVDCATPIKKFLVRCDPCNLKAMKESHHQKVPVRWDGFLPIYSHLRDKFYCNPEEASEDLSEGESLDDLLLVACEPEYSRLLDNSYFYDQVPDHDGYIPDKILEAIDAFNETVGNIVVAWNPVENGSRLLT